MTMEIMDAISELQITLKKEAAILELFINNFTAKPKDEALLAVKSSFEEYQYTAHVIADLMHQAKEQAETLDNLSGDAWNQHKCG